MTDIRSRAREYLVRALTPDEVAHVRGAIAVAHFRPTAKRCFEQSQKLISFGVTNRLTYVEGIADQIHHGWLAFADGAVVDITRGQFGSVRKSAREFAVPGRLDGNSMATRYWGVPFERDAVIVAVQRGAFEPLLSTADYLAMLGVTL